MDKFCKVRNGIVMLLYEVVCLIKYFIKYRIYFVIFKVIIGMERVCGFGEI